MHLHPLVWKKPLRGYVKNKRFILFRNNFPLLNKDCTFNGRIGYSKQILFLLMIRASSLGTFGLRKMAARKGMSLVAIAIDALNGIMTFARIAKDLPKHVRVLFGTFFWLVKL